MEHLTNYIITAQTFSTATIISFTLVFICICICITVLLYCVIKNIHICCEKRNNSIDDKMLEKYLNIRDDQSSTQTNPSEETTSSENSQRYQRQNQNKNKNKKSKKQR